MSFPRNGFGHHAFEIFTHEIPKEGFDISIRCMSKPFSLDPKLKAFVSQLREHWQKESPNLTNMPSIVSVRKVQLLQNHKVVFTCRKATFFDFLFTNCSLDVELKNPDRTITTLREMLEKEELGQDSLESVSRIGSTYSFPDLGNSLSISIAIETRDNQLIACFRRPDSHSYSKDKGCWVCPVAIHVKRHEPRFLDDKGNPSAQLSVLNGIADELGEDIAETCEIPVCLGVVYREDLRCCCLCYRVTSSFTAGEFIKRWVRTGLMVKQEYDGCVLFRLDQPEKLLNHLEKQENRWSPQHSAAMFMSLAYSHPKLVSKMTGLYF